jgi:hypothetical protein
MSIQNLVVDRTGLSLAETVLLDAMLKAMETLPPKQQYTALRGALAPHKDKIKLVSTGGERVGIVTRFNTWLAEATNQASLRMAYAPLDTVYAAMDEHDITFSLRDPKVKAKPVTKDGRIIGVDAFIPAENIPVSLDLWGKAKEADSAFETAKLTLAKAAKLVKDTATKLSVNIERNEDGDWVAIAPEKKAAGPRTPRDPNAPRPLTGKAYWAGYGEKLIAKDLRSQPAVVSTIARFARAQTPNLTKIGTKGQALPFTLSETQDGKSYQMAVQWPPMEKAGFKYGVGEPPENMK